MKNLLKKLRLTKMFFALTLLGVYSASMYKIASLQPPHTDVIDMPISATHADMKKILDIVEPRAHEGSASTYLPGVACIIDAGPDTTAKMMQEYFSNCLGVHEDFLSMSPIIE